MGIRCQALVLSSLLSFLLCAATSPRLWAWTPQAQLVITTEGAKLGPPDFYRQIEKHETSFKEGVLAPFGDTDPSRHYRNADGGGQLDLVIEVEAQRAIEYITSHRPFRDIVHQVGLVSYFVAAANNPLNTSATDGNEGQYYKDYAEYLESAVPRLPVVFYGLDNALDAGQLGEFVNRSLERGRLFYPMIGTEYRRIGKLPGRLYFDDRSTAFGVSSVAFSRALSDVALVLRYIWIQAGGADRRAAPREADGLLLVVSRSDASANATAPRTRGDTP